MACANEKDPREKLTSDFLQSLIGMKLSTTLSPLDMQLIKNLLIVHLDNYELQNRCTEIVTVDTSSEKILNVYFGSLLTEGKSINTVITYRNLLLKFLREIEKPFVEVKYYDILTWLAKQQQSIQLITCENYRSYLSAFYRWLFLEELIDKNPMDKIKPIHFDKGVKKEFSEVEIDKLRSSCKTLRDRALFEFLLSSGVRVSEASNMNISDINFNDLSVVVRHRKGNKSRKTYINQLCASHLQNYLNSRKDMCDYLFITRNNTRLSRSMIEKHLRKIGKCANVSNVHPHRCRRTFATMLIKKGMDIHSIQKLMGHSKIDTTVEYLSINDDYLKNEYNRYM